MTFRLPFQISRANAFLRPASPNRLLEKVSVRNQYDVKNLHQLAKITSSKNLLHAQKYKTSHLPKKCIHSKIFIRNVSKESKENREKIRNLNKCDETREETKLAFRQTTIEECKECIPLPPTQAPPLGRPERMYDDSKFKYEHEYCPVETNNPPRMDEVKCYKIKRKQLPCVPESNCPRLPPRPQTTPGLERLPRNYDPLKLKWKFEYCPATEDKPVRMDDVCGYKVEPQELPTIKSNNCKQCLLLSPLTAPMLRKPKCRYDQSSMKYKFDNCFCPDECAPRMDNVVGLEVQDLELPEIPAGDCPRCRADEPTYAPDLTGPTQRYDPSKMEHKYENYVEDECNINPPRLDDVRGLKIKKKSLPKINEDYCQQCDGLRPTTAPILKRPKACYNFNKLKKVHETCIDEEPVKPERMDDVLCYNGAKPKCLPPPPCSKCGQYEDQLPTKSPTLGNPKKIYDDFKLKYNHEYKPVDISNIKPPRMDKVRCYRVTKKKLPPVPDSADCNRCKNPSPSYSPSLVKPSKRFDESKMKYRHSDHELSPVNVDPPRLDNVVGYKVEPRNLPTLKPHGCKKCLAPYPGKSPKLPKLQKRYDPTTMPWEHKNCQSEIIERPRRMDDVVGYKVVEKELPELKNNADCVRCGPLLPTKSPKLGRPKAKFNPNTEREICQPDLCECDLNPPRMDDVLCWTPRKKKLPSFLDQSNKRSYCTFTRNSQSIQHKIPKYTIYSRVRCTNRLNLNNNMNIARYYASDCKKKGRKSPCKIMKKRPKVCQKIKVPHCSPRLRKSCDSWPETICKKTDSPYESFGDAFPGFWEEVLTECENIKQKQLQPKNQKTETFFLMKSIVPKWKVVDPDLEKQCLKDKECEPQYPFVEDKWKSPTTTFKLKYCQPRQRQHCGEFPVLPPCKKLNAPYESFSDKCPQFPPLELTECDLAERFADNAMNMLGKKCKLPKPILPKHVECDLRTGEPRRVRKNRPRCQSIQQCKCQSVSKSSVAKLSSTAMNQQGMNMYGKNMSSYQKMEACKQLVKWKRKTRVGLLNRLANFFKAREGFLGFNDIKDEKVQDAVKAAKAAGLEVVNPTMPVQATKATGPEVVNPTIPVKTKHYLPSNMPHCSDSCTPLFQTVRKTTCIPKKTTLLKKEANNQCRKYSTLAVKNRPFISCAAIQTRRQKIDSIKKQILANKSKLDIENILQYSTRNETRSQKRSFNYADKYIGKIYKLKLTKIGVKNTLIKRKEEDEPHTICYICKVVPRYHDLYNDSDSNLKDIKLRSNRERRKVF